MQPNFFDLNQLTKVFKIFCLCSLRVGVTADKFRGWTCIFSKLWQLGPLLQLLLGRLLDSSEWGRLNTGLSVTGNVWPMVGGHKMIKQSCNIWVFLITGILFFKEGLCVFNESPWRVLGSFHRMSKSRPENNRIDSPKRKSEHFTAREDPCIAPRMLINPLQLTCQNSGVRQIFKPKSGPRSNIMRQIFCTFFAWKPQSNRILPCTNYTTRAMWLSWC